MQYLFGITLRLLDKHYVILHQVAILETSKLRVVISGFCMPYNFAVDINGIKNYLLK